MPIEICPREQCTGCAACFNICPIECISMVADGEGFLRPNIDSMCCDECGECLRVCPILHINKPSDAFIPQIYACRNKDEAIRFQSSSGGAFSALAGWALDQGGIVFGAAFDEDMRLMHTAVDKKRNLGKLRSSKYVQSDIGRAYGEVSNFLRQNRKVLFSGTPCQIAGLHAFLGQEQDNLLSCDVLCKGVPSPGIFAKYIGFLEKRFRAKLNHINFRHKRLDWNATSTVAFFDDGRERVLTGNDNSFMEGFSKCVSLRPGCYRCPHTTVHREGDITLGDFWGIGDLLPFNQSTRNGISLVLVNSEKGRRWFQDSSSQVFFETRTLEEAKHKQIVLDHPVNEPKNRGQFFADYQRLEYGDLGKKYLVDKGLKGLIKRFVPRSWIFFLRRGIKKTLV